MDQRRNRRPTRRHDSMRLSQRWDAVTGMHASRLGIGQHVGGGRYAVPQPYGGGRARPGLAWRVPALVIPAVILVVACILAIRSCVSTGSDPGGPAGTGQAGEGGGPVVIEAEATLEPVEVRLAMIGDILQHRGVYDSGLRDDGTYNFDHVFEHVAGYLNDQDIKVVNQETPLGGAELGYSGYPTFNGPQEMGDAEVAAGFNVVLRASNHAMDRGYDGLRNEVAFWTTSHPEVGLIGAVDPDAAATGSADPYQPYVWEKDGFTIALLNFTYDLNGFEDPHGAIANLYDARAIAAIEHAEGAADLTVVFPHWGTEYQLTADDDQRRMAQAFIDAGADVIIGGHPHVIEPLEVLTSADGRQVPCFWSVGNFISTQIDNENLVGCLAKVILRKEADGRAHAVSAEFWPTVTHKGVGTSMTTYLLPDYTDELASTNYLASNETYNYSLTPAWADEFCAQVLGGGYDMTRHVLCVDLAA